MAPDGLLVIAPLADVPACPARQTFPEAQGSSGFVCVYVEDVDATIAGVEQPGGTTIREAADMPWGERVGFVAELREISRLVGVGCDLTSSVVEVLRSRA